LSPGCSEPRAPVADFVLSVCCVCKCLVLGCAAVYAAAPEDCSVKSSKCTPTVCFLLHCVLQACVGVWVWARTHRSFTDSFMCVLSVHQFPAGDASSYWSGAWKKNPSVAHNLLTMYQGRSIGGHPPPPISLLSFTPTLSCCIDSCFQRLVSANVCFATKLVPSQHLCLCPRLAPV
jgi:hypothetical protein